MVLCDDYNKRLRLRSAGRIEFVSAPVKVCIWFFRPLPPPPPPGFYSVYFLIRKSKRDNSKKKKKK